MNSETESVVLKVTKNDSNPPKMQEKDEAKAHHNWDSFYSLPKFLDWMF